MNASPLLPLLFSAFFSFFQRFNLSHYYLCAIRFLQLLSAVQTLLRFRRCLCLFPCLPCLQLLSVVQTLLLSSASPRLCGETFPLLPLPLLLPIPKLPNYPITPSAPQTASAPSPPSPNPAAVRSHNRYPYKHPYTPPVNPSDNWYKPRSPCPAFPAKPVPPGSPA